MIFITFDVYKKYDDYFAFHVEDSKYIRELSINIEKITSLSMAAIEKDDRKYSFCFPEGLIYITKMQFIRIEKIINNDIIHGPGKFKRI